MGLQHTASGLKLKIAIKSPALEGKANSALIDFLSALLKLPKSQIKLLKGDLNRNKKVILLGVDNLPNELLDLKILN